ncbi:MAG: AAA family ATPase [Clostridia bacterium]|nr:AAA family ATPase [Clostridia bacterium]
MGIGIQICGLNGSGKSTLGRALAEKIGFYFIDDENLYFSSSNPNEPYTNPKPRHEVEQLLMNEVKNHPDFVFAAVKGDYEKDIISMYDYVIMLEVPQSVRSQRVRNRSFKKFGSRMLLGGDLYNQEEAFFQMVESRQGSYVENWLQTVKCPIIRVDGTKPIDENVEYIINSISI